jgi:MFS superfamily sulfate permease-like transporter
MSQPLIPDDQSHRHPAHSRVHARHSQQPSPHPHPLRSVPPLPPTSPPRPSPAPRPTGQPAHQTIPIRRVNWPPPAPSTMSDAPTTSIPRVVPGPGDNTASDTGTPAEARAPRGRFADYRQDILASVVVFLVALPLCIGIAVASGVKPEAAIITGIVGGIITGLLPGSTLQVSGPAAGLAVLVLDTVQRHGVHTLGVIVLLAGVLQIAMGLVRLGKWFQAIASSVVAGMLSGIGLLILAGQIYVLADQKGPGNAVENLLGLPALLHTVSDNPAARSAAVLGVCGLMIMILWKKAPKVLQLIPGPLAAVVAVTVLAAFFHADVQKLSVGALADAIHLPDAASIGALLQPDVLGVAFAFALIASAESLFSATAMDQMHDGPKTKYDKELIAQGAGNVVSGFLGALPMTAVIARSAANVHAGAKTKLSRILHGVWMLAFAVLVPGVLRLIPITVLAVILVYSGWKLLNPQQIRPLWRQDRGETAVLVITALAIVATDLLEGVVIGLMAALVKLAWRMSHLIAEQHPGRHQTTLHMTGGATFLAIPKLHKALHDLPGGHIHIDMGSLVHLDRTCRSAVENWARQRRKEGATVTITLPPDADEHFEDLSSH